MAMDFSGQTGRVIENPAEAQSAALEEGHAWRVRPWPCPAGTGSLAVATPRLICPQKRGCVLASGGERLGGWVAVSSQLQEALALLGSSMHPATPPPSSLGSRGGRGKEQSPGFPRLAAPFLLESSGRAEREARHSERGSTSN